MRTHLQGTFLLIVLLLVFWGMLNWAAPIIDDAIFGDDGAVVAKAPQNLIDPNDPEAAALLEANRPLEGAEVADLQEVLLLLGYNPGPVDGIMGDLTRAAIEEAKADAELSQATDRELLQALEADQEAADTDISDNSEELNTAPNTDTGTNTDAAPNADTSTDTDARTDTDTSASVTSLP